MLKLKRALKGIQLILGGKKPCNKIHSREVWLSEPGKCGFNVISVPKFILTYHLSPHPQLPFGCNKVESSTPSLIHSFLIFV